MQDVGIRVDMAQVERDLKAAHYAIPNELRAALRESAEEVALPIFRERFPSFARPLLTARSTLTRAYIAMRGPMALDRAAGLLNYGGTVRGRIEPRRAGRQRTLNALTEAIPSANVGRTTGARALSLPWGPRAAVSKPRRYRGRHFIEQATQESVGGVTDRVRDKQLAIYSERGWNTEKGGPGG